MTYWLVTTFDKERRKEQFHVEGRIADDALSAAAHYLYSHPPKHDAVEVHVQKLTPAERDSLVRRRP